MDLGLKGKWALVGGASKGLGLGCATALAQAGVNVVMVSRGAEALEASAAKLRLLGVTVLTVAQDITTEAGRAAIWSVAGQSHGGRHGLARFWTHRQHHLQRGQSPDRYFGFIQRCSQWLDGFCGWTFSHHGFGWQQCHHQQPFARRF